MNSILNNIKALTNEIPAPIRLFLGKALLLFVAWKIIYSFFLYDSQYVDHRLSTHVGEASTYVLNNYTFLDGFTTKRAIRSTVYDGVRREHEVSNIYHHDKKVLHIANSCNGLELMVLYIGFIVAMPSRIWRKIYYIILGVLVLDFINILRSTGLIYLREYFHAYFDFAHHYLFKITIYATTFLIWMLYARKIQLKDETIQNG